VVEPRRFPPSFAPEALTLHRQNHIPHVSVSSNEARWPSGLRRYVKEFLNNIMIHGSVVRKGVGSNPTLVIHISPSLRGLSFCTSSTISQTCGAAFLLSVCLTGVG
jgi:hypothetical protein